MIIDPNVTYIAMRYSLRYVHHRSILLPLLRLTPPMEGFPCDDFRKISQGGQGMAKVQNDEEMLLKVSIHWVVRTNVTNDRRICDSNDPNVTHSHVRVQISSSLRTQEACSAVQCDDAIRYANTIELDRALRNWRIDSLNRGYMWNDFEIFFEFISVI